MTETISRIASLIKREYQFEETKYTSFDPPTYSVLDNEKDTDKASDEVLNNQAYIAYCESVLGCRRSC